MARQFHTSTAKLLFLCKRARPDLQKAIAFLTTRVKEPDKDDRKKLCRVILSLNGMVEYALTLSTNSLNVPKWWVDGTYAVHQNLRGHTGITLSVGKGSLLSWSMNQYLNTKSSTKTELVGMDNTMPHILWTSYFHENQGYSVKTATVYQDNDGAMLLEKNGSWESGKGTKHINVCYFL
eukprot:8697448-Ditylum_brightwellii.AAC.1